MFDSGAPPRRRRIVLAILAACLVIGASGAVLFGGSASAQETSVSVESLSVEGGEQTVDGDVSDVTLATTVGYNYSVESASERIVEVRAGPSPNDLQTLTFERELDPAATARGSTDLSASLLEAGFDAEDFQPPTAGTTTQEVTVETTLEVTRENGEVVERTARDTATITIHDDGTLSASVGGTATVTVETTA